MTTPDAAVANAAKAQATKADAITANAMRLLNDILLLCPWLMKKLG
jgi:hypothetical protein